MLLIMFEFFSSIWNKINNLLISNIKVKKAIFKTKQIAFKKRQMTLNFFYNSINLSNIHRDKCLLNTHNFLDMIKS
ncbi:hypothetical protein BpHYR1_008693 [Brachionus plicatilis]|uniref:Uncharacterized protein n=1 Tax=Brachionus plicatilis TaxID=10195 RepID=A0A3M7RHY6_BRAPC|nr:hypothetical protein BpHYR1_008693 [Brachionus plicatilis]